ncbi:AlpA family phage regulatory protein [Kerstersia gyiorum]|uniref:helix-turn-helix transcriptional regulator n=1 Tax=Kerstersia gyiorum TaxID=206506 RepID=UPI0010708E31|nr:AlpA family phage regulatory protein [Kerstersia gyiorum]QBR40559.1 AlpA family phage regulatory protein [Kerstersia gyiorum]
MHTATFNPARLASSTAAAKLPPEVYAAALPTTGYVRLPMVASVCGLAKSTVWKWVSQGRFPAPVKLSTHVSAWNVSALRDWLADPQAWQAANLKGAQQ